MSKSHREDACSFETRRIKKERSENIENANRGIGDLPGGVATPVALTETRIPNGFHASDILQEIITAKLSGNSSSNPAKNDKIRMIIEDAVSEESRSRVHEIFLKVEQMRIEEKLLLYMKLPTCLTSGSAAVDPLRQPLNPLGNRYEIHQTIMWIKTHLEEDPDVSLPKQEVYDEYNIFCMRNSMKPLSTADFGKVMKQVYPKVRPRRLGTRGNSRYCYAGMRKRVKLDSPMLPNINDGQEMEEFDEPITEEMLGAASTLIREWAEGVLGMKFGSLSALARYLVDNMCVDTQSLAAVCILSANGDAHPLPPKIPETPPSLSVTPVAGKPGKMREAQLQLAKKLQQREHIREQKAPCKVDKIEGSTKPNPPKSKKPKSSSSPIITTTPKLSQQPPTTSNRSRKLPRLNQVQSSVSLQLNCDKKNSINNDEKISAVSPQLETKNPSKSNNRKRPSVESSSETSPEKQQKLEKKDIKIEDKVIAKAEKQSTPKITVVGADILKPKQQKIDADLPKSQKKPNGKNSHPETPEIFVKDEISMLDDHSSFLDKNPKLCAIDPDALDDYLNGGNNSQEPEEELLQYFQQSSSSSSDAEVNLDSSIRSSASRSDKVSQLRLILQQNLKSQMAIETTNEVVEPTSELLNSQETPLNRQAEDKTQLLPSLLNNQNNKRRVSFETNVVEHVHQDMSLNTVPQSPNTRRRIFNFTPISPGPHSPVTVLNGRGTSKPNSANASPFVSPRNTPVPRSRSTMPCRSARSNSNGPSTNGKQFSRSVSCSASYLPRNDESTFVVPTSTSGTAGKSLEVKALTNFLTTEVNPQKQLLINYPSQENLQEIKNVYKKSKPADQEISEYFNGVKPPGDSFCRSQSVPLHRMVNPTLMSPISSAPYALQYQFSASSSSSVAPTPVPSEFNDFGSTCLLDEVDANFIGEEQGFLMEDKDISNENITKILNFLDEDDGKSFIEASSGIILESQTGNIDEGLSLPTENILDPGSVLEAGIGDVEDIQKIIHTQSYPNTPLSGGSVAVVYPAAFTEDSNGSRSFPSTPQVYRESNEPMLSSPTLNSLNLTSDNGAGGARGVSDLLETNFLGEHDAEEELDPLGNFEGSFQDVDALGPLFNEVGDGNR